ATPAAIEIDAAAPSTVSIAGGNGQTGAIDSALGTPLSVSVHDAYSNATPNVTVTWSVGSGGGSLGSSTSQTNASGVATDSWTLGTLLGAQTVVATAAGL